MLDTDRKHYWETSPFLNDGVYSRLARVMLQHPINLAYALLGRHLKPTPVPANEVIRVLPNMTKVIFDGYISKAIALMSVAEK